ncbi:MAG: Crp/Fnr family transcriptional regulator [Thermoleophilaceae bacterium]|nr:Crp/Fnr family transcriptional regulator [Thermoleophilaceae bacterium]
MTDGTAYPPICVLHEDPDLGAAIPAEDRLLSARASVARVHSFSEGELEIPAKMEASDTLGLLLLDGFLGGFVEVEGRSNLELLGAGDVTQPWVHGHPNVSVRRDIAWRVLTPTRVAVLDGEFMRRISPWPQVAAALFNRGILRARNLTFLLAVNALPRIDERVLLLLWHLADRWGRVTSEGVSLELPLTQGQISMMIGAQRPSVTTAISQLREEGRLESVTRGVWLLRPPPPGLLVDIKGRVGLPAASDGRGT